MWLVLVVAFVRVVIVIVFVRVQMRGAFVMSLMLVFESIVHVAYCCVEILDAVCGVNAFGGCLIALWDMHHGDSAPVVAFGN